MASDHDAYARELREREEQLERERLSLLDGEWVGAAAALTLMMAGSSREEAAAGLLRYAATETNRQPMVRSRASLIQLRHPTTGHVRREADRALHLYEWQGQVKQQHWETGLFEVVLDAMAGYRITLHEVRFSLDDLQALLGTPLSRVEAVASASRPRRRQFDRQAFINKAADILADEGGFGPDYSQADLFAAMDEWCNERWPITPSRTWMYDRWGEAEAAYKASLS